MSEIVLSYVVNTRNKLPFLKEAMKRLLENRQPDEEVVVVDGASTDGSVEYLMELHRSGRIDQFLSEPDVGEAHGWNKGLLLARGRLIKIISDDDVFHYPSIRRCREFMMQHPEVSVLGTNGANTTATSGPGVPYRKWPSTEDFKKLCRNGGAMDFCGLGLIIRRSHLALTGLFHTGVVRVDCEYAYRVTSGRVNIAWFAGFVFIRIENDQSSGRIRRSQIQNDTRRITFFYTNKFPEKPRNWRLMVPKPFRRMGGHAYRFFFPPDAPEEPVMQQPAELFARGDLWLAAENKNAPGEFLMRASAASSRG